MDAVRAAVARLAAANARTELRVDLAPGRGLRRGSWRMVPRGVVWRLGALCLDETGALFATGQVLVVTPPTHPNFRSSLALQRNELRRLAARAGIAPGQTVIVDARPLDPTADALDAPLAATPGGVGVVWAAGATPTPLAPYLEERVALLLDPPG
ncbi:MAG: glutaminase [Leifsonia sp.]|nr:glutaminase [Leifsonia sp.]